MTNPFHCSFCAKSKDDVELLIAGPEVFICDSCVMTCNKILEEKRIRKVALELLKEREDKNA